MNKIYHFNHFKDGYNYIGSPEISFKHNKSSYEIVVTTDKQQVIDGNRFDNKNSTVFCYFPDRALQEMRTKYDYSKLLQCMTELNQWKTIANIMNDFSSSYRMYVLG